jgi:hypothetical protein
MAALGELYAHYRRTERMMSNILRDEETMHIVKRMLGGYRDYLTAARDALKSGRRGRGRARQLGICWALQSRLSGKRPPAG